MNKMFHSWNRVLKCFSAYGCILLIAYCILPCYNTPHIVFFLLQYPCVNYVSLKSFLLLFSDVWNKSQITITINIKIENNKNHGWNTAHGNYENRHIQQ